MIIVRLSGGLGNQLFQYAMGRSVADYHKVELKLDLSAYNSLKTHRMFMLKAFNIRASIAGDMEVARLKGGNNTAVRALRSLGLLRRKTYFAEKENGSYDARVFSSAERYLAGYWQSPAYFDFNGDNILSDLRVVDALGESNSTYKKAVSECNSVSLHVRRGDYLSIPEIGVLDIAYYENAVAFLEKRCHKPFFFIFSDDIEWCKANLSFIAKSFYVESTGSELEDFILMSMCRHNIIANSTFSWWSAWLNKAEEKMVIAPRQWTSKAADSKDRIPDGWVEL